MLTTEIKDKALALINEQLGEQHYLLDLRVVGSRAQGFETEDSDYDIHGIVDIPTWEHIFKLPGKISYPIKIEVDGINIVLKDKYSWLQEIINHQPDAYLLLMSDLLIFQRNDQEYQTILHHIKETVNLKLLAQASLRLAQGIVRNHQDNEFIVTPSGLAEHKLLRIATMHYLNCEYIRKMDELPTNLKIEDKVDLFYSKRTRNKWSLLANLMLHEIIVEKVTNVKKTIWVRTLIDNELTLVIYVCGAKPISKETLSTMTDNKMVERLIDHWSANLN